tara:strand:- start:10420 stop:10617 length:198 start_codon:yes stop_codon:yes gene_type:complete
MAISLTVYHQQSSEDSAFATVKWVNHQSIKVGMFVEESTEEAALKKLFENLGKEFSRMHNLQAAA